MVLVVVALWGGSFPLTKMALEHAGPTAIAFLRWCISAMALAGYLAWRGRRGGPGLAAAGTLVRREWRTVTWLALTGVTLYYALQNLALRFTTATNAGVLSNLVSVFMILIAARLLHERLTGKEWGALVAAFAGSVLVSQGAGHLTVGGPGLLGDGLMVLASLMAAIYSIGGKRLTERYPAELVITTVATGGALLLAPLAVAEGIRLDLPWQTWLILAVVGVGSGAVANLWWLQLLSRIPASRAALVLLLTPVVSATVAVVVLREPLTLPTVLGAALVLSGVLAVPR